MIDRMHDRCMRICGTTDGDCYVNRKEQLNCISDMVINKTTGISMILGFAFDEPDKQSRDEFISEAITSSNELSNWVRYLQKIKNLREMSSLVLDSDENDKRTEIRYSVPEQYKGNVRVFLSTPDGERESMLVNFSQSGVGIRTATPPGIGSEISLRVAGPSGDEGLAVMGRAMYSIPPGPDGLCGVGARIINIGCHNRFNFFNLVFDIMTDPMNF